MVIYQSERTNKFDTSIKQWLINLLIYSILPIADYLFPQFGIFKNTDWTALFVVFSISNLIQLCRYDRVNEIHIDTNRKKILVRYYDFNEGQTSKALSFENLKVRINKGLLLNRSSVQSISLLDGKSEEFEISTYKDGYLKKSLSDLAGYLESLTHPVSK
jgi:hypothetical protein